ncbi:MAG: PEP-CTERM sorting domain-containing protein [Candidatus Nealsonbacteria bacterium]|nr:PEP-CTERM sorting domain-containing protein [Candidatus Nealsonbacteria bacterium]
MFGTLAARSPARAAFTPSTAQWLGTSDGLWDDSARWSTPQYPNNGTPGATDTYQAEIKATGADYRVTVQEDVTVDALTITSANARLLQSGGTFHVDGAVRLEEGAIELNGGVMEPGELWIYDEGSLTVNAGQLATSGHVTVEGILETVEDDWGRPGSTRLLGGIEIRSGGKVSLGWGPLEVNDDTSGMDSGQLSALSISVGNSGSGRFTHTGGSVNNGGSFETLAVSVGTGEGGDGYYELSGTGTIGAESLFIGSSDSGQGHFRQLGGFVSAYLQTVVNANGLYELIDGTLAGYDTAVSGRFIQTGGYLDTRAQAWIASSGSFELRGGRHKTANIGLHVGTHRDSTASYVVSGTGEHIGELLRVGNGLFRQEGGKATFGEETRIEPSSGRTGRIELVGGEFSSGTLMVDGDTPEAAIFQQSGGTCTLVKMQAGSNRYSLPAHGGTYSIDGGELLVTGIATIGPWRKSSSNNPAGHGVLQIGGGSATFDEMVLGEEFGDGGSGTLEITAADAQTRVRGSLKLRENAVVSAVPGATVRIGGLLVLPSSVENKSTDEAALAGLNHLALLFDGGPNALSTLELAGNDLGPDTAGLALNFALDTLQIGGDDPAQLQLLDAFDNQEDGAVGNEALYVRNLEIGPESRLDLNGLNVYCLNASIDPMAVVLENGGTLTVVPEPSTFILLAIGAVGLLACRWRRVRETHLSANGGR